MRILRNKFKIRFNYKNILPAFAKFTKQFDRELFIVFTILVLFADLALLSPFTNKAYISPLSALGIISLNGYYSFLISSVFKSPQGFKFKTKVSPVLIPIIVFTIIRLFFMDAMPRWDSSVYFNALTQTIPNFSLTLKSFVTNFNWYQHPTMGFALFVSLAQFFQPGNLITINIINILLGILGIYSFYKIVVYFGGEEDVAENVLITSLFAVNPLFVGVSTAFLPDFGVLIFFLVVFASFLYNKLIFTFFFGTILVFSKETGALTYGLFVLSYFLLVWLKEWLKSRKIDKFRMVAMFSPLIILVGYFQAIKWELWPNRYENAFYWGTNCQFCFGINSFSITQNLLIIFVISFNWVLTLFILANIIKQEIYFPFGFNTRPLTLRVDMFRVLSFVFGGFVLFFMTYVIYSLPSYMVLSSGLLTLIFFISLRNLIISKKHRLLILITLIPIFFIQIFKTIDPVSKHVFGTFKFGDHEVLRISTEQLADGFIYNTQYVYTDRLLTMFIKEFNITSDDTLFMEPHAWGAWYTGWGRFRDKQPKIVYLTDKIGSFPDNLYFLTFPIQYYGPKDFYKIRDGYQAPLLNPDLILNELKNKYEISESKKIEIDGYWIMVYKLVKNK